MQKIMLAIHSNLNSFFVRWIGRFLSVVALVFFLTSCPSFLQAVTYWSPMGIATDGSGNLYVVDYEWSYIYKYNGSSWTVIGGGLGTGMGEFNGPEGIAYHSGNIYVADAYNDRIQKYNGSSWSVYAGGTGTGKGQFETPAGVVVDSCYGDVYVADSFNKRIQRNDGSGWFVMTGTFGYPCFMAEDGYYVYVADEGSNIIKKIHGTSYWTDVGSGAGTNPGQFNAPWGVAVDGSHTNIWVADTFNDRIQKYNGKSWTVIGGGQGTNPGQFYRPYGIAYHAGNIYVTDTYNQRIQQYNGSTWTIIATSADIPGEQHATLMLRQIEALRLRPEVANSYRANLKKVRNFISEIKIEPAINQLEAFIKKVESDSKKEKVKEDEGNLLIRMATDLIEKLQ
jgi:DNA-binding beta-propeller fold protein YncE